MPCVSYHLTNLRRFGTKIGHTICIDKFTRVAVEIGLVKPLMTKFKIDRWPDVEYEGLPQICFSYGKVVHNLSIYLHKPTPTKETDQISVDVYGVRHQMKDVEDGSSGSHSSKYGPWLHTPTRAYRSNEKEILRLLGDKPSSKGYRFQMLSNLNEDEVVVTDKDTANLVS